MGDTNAMLAVVGLANLVAKNHQKSMNVVSVVEKITSLLPSDHKKLEIYISTFLHNLSVHFISSTEVLESLELHILLLSTILTILQPAIKQVESKEVLLITLSNILHTKQQELIDLAQSMDIQTFNTQ